MEQQKESSACKMRRYAANKRIVSIIARLAERCPELRFQQLLQNLDIASMSEDRFYEESEVTLKHAEDAGVKIWMQIVRNDTSTP